MPKQEITVDKRKARAIVCGHVANFMTVTDLMKSLSKTKNMGSHAHLSKSTLENLDGFRHEYFSIIPENPDGTFNMFRALEIACTAVSTLENSFHTLNLVSEEEFQEVKEILSSREGLELARLIWQKVLSRMENNPPEGSEEIRRLQAADVMLESYLAARKKLPGFSGEDAKDLLKSEGLFA